MSILDDIKELDRIKDNILDKVRSPEQLMEKIQGIQDIVDQHIHELEGIPDTLERWKDTLDNIGLYSDNTDFPYIAKDSIFKDIYQKTTGIIDSAMTGLFGKSSSLNAIKHKEILFYSINDVKIDYIYEPNPSYKTTTESQPIISANSNIDRLNENAENENPTIKYKCILVGSDAQERFDKINDLRQNKQLVKIVTNKVFEKLLITSLKPYYDCSPNTLEFEISLEKIFVAEMRRVRIKEKRPISTSIGKNKKTENQIVGYDPFKKNVDKLNDLGFEKPIPKEQKPINPVIDCIKKGIPIGTIDALKWELDNPVEPGLYAN